MSSAGINGSSGQEETPAVNDMAFDGVDPNLESFAIGVMPGDELPLLVCKRQGLSVHAIVLSVVEGVGQGDVKPIKAGAEIVAEGNDDKNVVT
jgi:hypothetical protein